MDKKPILKEAGTEALKQAVGWIVVAALTLVGKALVKRQASLLTSATAIWDTLTGHAVPLWLFLAVVVGGFFGWLRVYRNRQKSQLHVVWEPESTLWGEGRMGNEPLMQIIGSALFSHTYPNVNLLLIQAFFNGTKPAYTIDPPIEVNYGITVKRRFSLFVKPVKGKAGKPFEGRLIFVDQLNRKHPSPRISFSFVGVVPKPEP